MSTRPRIVLIHATPVSIDPIKAAFARLWPEPELVNILDDSLAPDRARTADLDDAMRGRFDALSNYAIAIGAKAILFTCSAFGPAIETNARRLPIPVLKPNEAMFEEALARGGRIGMISTFAPSVPTMEAEFAEEAGRLRPDATLRTHIVPEAMEALRGGDDARHNRLVAERAGAVRDLDALMLGQFSMSRAHDAASAVAPCPVLTSPDAAVRKLKRLMLEPRPA